MAKTIKFNLICDESPIRTIEDLQNNFSVEDVLAYYNNKLLHRWLDVRGYTEELEKVNNITTENMIEVAKELIRIFDVICDAKKIEEGVYILKYLEEKKQSYSIYEKENFKVRNIIQDYETGYRNLVEEILEKPNDIAKIKSNIAEMVTDYPWILKLDHRNLFYQMYQESPLAVMCLLMNEQSREYYLPIQIESEDGIIWDISKNQDKANMYGCICNMIGTNGFEDKLGENLMKFKGNTDAYWKDIEPKGKKCMIISMQSGDFVRSAGVSGGDMGYSEINKRFRIVDGIDYKSNSSTHQLLYMEV